MTRKKPNKGANDAELIIAASAMAELQSYLGRGRHFKSQSDEELNSNFVHLMRLWANDPIGWAGRQQLNDVQAEFSLRDTEPPHYLLKSEIDAITRGISAAFEALSQEALNESGKKVEDDLKELKNHSRIHWSLHRELTPSVAGSA